MSGKSSTQRRRGAELAKQMEAAARRVYDQINGERAVEVQYELTISPGGLTTSQFVMRIGSCLSNDSSWSMHESLEAVVLETLSKCEKLKTAKERELDELKERAQKLGYVIALPEKGGSR